MARARVSRLERALALDCETRSDGRVEVRGGAGPHLVAVAGAGGACDCADFLTRGGPCKHLLAVRLHRGDPALLKALAALMAELRRGGDPTAGVGADGR